MVEKYVSLNWEHIFCNYQGKVLPFTYIRCCDSFSVFNGNAFIWYFATGLINNCNCNVTADRSFDQCAPVSDPMILQWVDVSTICFCFWWEFDEYDDKLSIIGLKVCLSQKPSQCVMVVKLLRPQHILSAATYVCVAATSTGSWPFAFLLSSFSWEKCKN